MTSTGNYRQHWYCGQISEILSKVPAACGKVRWRLPGRGKSGGIRVIYYWVVDDSHIRMLYAYEKSDQEDLTPDQLKLLKAIVERW